MTKLRKWEVSWPLLLDLFQKSRNGPISIQCDKQEAAYYGIGVVDKERQHCRRLEVERLARTCKRVTRDAFERQYTRRVTRPCHTTHTVIMSSFAQHGNDGEEIQPPQRPPSPPPHTTFAVRGVHVRLASPSTFERCSHDRRSVS